MSYFTISIWHNFNVKGFTVVAPNNLLYSCIHITHHHRYVPFIIAALFICSTYDLQVCSCTIHCNLLSPCEVPCCCKYSSLKLLYNWLCDTYCAIECVYIISLFCFDSQTPNPDECCKYIHMQLALVEKRIAWCLKCHNNTICYNMLNLVYSNCHNAVICSCFLYNCTDLYLFPVTLCTFYARNSCAIYFALVLEVLLNHVK